MTSPAKNVQADLLTQRTEVSARLNSPFRHAKPSFKYCCLHPVVPVFIYSGILSRSPAKRTRTKCTIYCTMHAIQYPLFGILVNQAQSVLLRLLGSSTVSKTFHPKLQMSASWWRYRKSLGIIKVSRPHLLGSKISWQFI